MAEWYYTQDGQQVGPVSFEQLQRMAGSGQVRGADLVWKEGMADWQAAQSVAGLFAAAGTATGYAAVPAPAPAYAPAPGYPQQADPSAGGTIGYYTPQQPLVQYAGFWLRFAAAFLDGLIIGIPFIIVAFVLGLVVGVGAAATSRGPYGSSGYNAGASATASILQLVLNIAEIVTFWLYSAYMESSPGMATLGKRIVGIKVTDLNGQRISFGQATGRYFAKILSALICYVGFMMAGFTERKQGLHDMVASTLVVRA